MMTDNLSGRSATPGAAGGRGGNRSPGESGGAPVRVRRGAACALLCLALVGPTACAGQVAPIPAPVSPRSQPGDSALTPAAGLRAELTALLVEHALLARQLAATVDVARGDVADPDVVATRLALDAVAVELSEVLGRAGRDSVPLLLGLWREHVESLLAGAVAQARRRDVDVLRAQVSLGGFAREYGQVAHALLPTLTRAEIEESLARLVLAETSPTGDLAVVAADLAALLAAGADGHSDLAGSSASLAADSRAVLTRLMVRHVRLLAITDPQPDDATAAALAEGASGLALALGGDSAWAEEALEAAWTRHTALLVQAATASATDSATLIADLEASQSELARLLASVLPESTTFSLRAALIPWVAALTRLGAERAAGGPAVEVLARQAADAGQLLATVLARAVAAHERLPG